MDATSIVEREIGGPVPEGWTVAPVMSGGGYLVGGQMRKGCEVHTVLAPEYRGKGEITREGLRGLFQPMLDEFGYVTSRASIDDRRLQVFMRRLGFTRTWEDGQFVYFMLTQLKED